MAAESGWIEDVVAGIRESTHEVQDEGRLAAAGLKGERDVAGVLEGYAWLYDPATVRGVGEAHRSEADPRARERLRRVYHYLLDGCLEARTAPLEDALASLEAEAVVEVGGESVAYHDVPVLLANEPDFGGRDRLHDAWLAVVERTNPERQAIVQTRLETLAREFGHGDYTAHVGEKKRVDHALLCSRLEGFLSRTNDTYAGLMGAWLEEATGRGLGEVGGHHLAHLFRAPRHDRYFDASGLLGAYARTLAGMGIDPEAQKNIHLDTEGRPSKDPRPSCWVPDPPGEVHLLLKPAGGLEDYASFLHEAGHAQHYGNTDPHLDYVFRAVPTSYALTEVYAFLLENLTQNPAWLRDVAGLPEEVAREAARLARLKDLFALRRYVALLRYELGLFENPFDEGRNRRLYAATLADATGFFYAPQRYLWDVDADYYSADYLRAWITEAVLRRHLEDAHGEGWFGSPEAGAFLRELWAAGEGMENEDIARMLGYEPFDTACLAERFLAPEG